MSAPAPDSPLRIDCASLDRENRSALEARARAEIALEPQPAGTIVVACSASGADLEWLPAGAGSARRRTVSLAGDPVLVVDRILDTVHAMRFARDDDPPAASSPAAAPIVATAPRRAGRSVRFGVVLTARGELWEGAISGAIDGQLGVRLATRTGWSVSAAGALGRGLEPGQGIDARTWSASLGVGRALSPRFQVALGGEWRRLVATQSVGGEIPGKSDEQHASTFGAFASLRYVLSQGPLSLAVGPDLIVLARPIVVDVSGGEAFRVPRLIAGLSVGGAADIVR